MYRNSWMAEVNDSSTNHKLRTHTLVTLDFSPKLYLYINIQKSRVALSRLRLNSHHLAIEMGRHTHPVVPVQQRLCTKCDLNVVDDEIHFVTECTQYQNKRNLMYHAVTPLICCQHGKFILLMTTDEITVLIALAKYICVLLGSSV